MNRRIFGIAAGFALLCASASGSATAAADRDRPRPRLRPPSGDRQVRRRSAGPRRPAPARGRRPRGGARACAATRTSSTRRRTSSPPPPTTAGRPGRRTQRAPQRPRHPDRAAGRPRAAGSPNSGASCPGRAPRRRCCRSHPGGINVVGAWENLVAGEATRGRGASSSRCSTPGSPTGRSAAASAAAPTSPPASSSRATTSSTTTAPPLDRNGHGTHVAGTIAEKTNNGIGLTGIAYRAKLMPVRVLDRLGRGRADDISEGIRWATDHGADVINMSFNFGCGKRVPGRHRSGPLRDPPRRRPGRLGRQSRLRVLRLGAGDDQRRDRRRRHHRGRLPRRLLAGRQGRRPRRPRRRRTDRRLPLGAHRPDLPGHLQGLQRAPLRRARASTSAPRWPPPTSPASPPWSSPAA